MCDKNCDEAHTRILDALFGNGREGMVAALARIDERLDAIDEKLDRRPNGGSGTKDMVKTIAAAVVTSLGVVFGKQAAGG